MSLFKGKVRVSMSRGFLSKRSGKLAMGKHGYLRIQLRTPREGEEMIKLHESKLDHIPGGDSAGSTDLQ